MSTDETLEAMREALRDTVDRLVCQARRANADPNRRRLPGGCPQCGTLCSRITYHRGRWITECCGQPLHEAGTAEAEVPIIDEMGL